MTNFINAYNWDLSLDLSELKSRAEMVADKSMA